MDGKKKLPLLSRRVSGAIYIVGKIGRVNPVMQPVPLLTVVIYIHMVRNVSRLVRRSTSWKLNLTMMKYVVHSPPFCD